ncbi:recombinase [Streptomyces sp.]|uniref:recombinase n=1 Tax=Streptomyces sp. TaxID=1931 RepID=UPI002F92CF2C
MNPKMLPRLDELEEDLEARRQQAKSEGWLGEIEGIDLTLQFLPEKRKQAQRAEQPSGVVTLGIPAVPPRP